MEAEVTISGLHEDAALQNAKLLAARYLGTPKSNASASAPQPTSLAVSPPAATKGIIHESKAFWDAYRSAIIRQVFEGNFGHERVDSSSQFHVLFTSYVESFSKSCHAYLPARHEAVTLSQATTKSDRNGNVVSQRELQSWTVDVDSRFAPEYREYARSLDSSSGETLALLLAIMSGRVSPTAYFDPGIDVIKFFETETCQSAAMRQLTENLLRAAEGRSSLQDAGDPNIVQVCVPESLIVDWKNPPHGSKMERFKQHFIESLRIHAKDPESDMTVWWWIDDRVYPTYDPATPLGKVVFSYAAGTCGRTGRRETLAINP